MIRALLLIFNGSKTWERIKTDQAGVTGISLRFLFPVLLLTSGAEVAGLIKFGVERGELGKVVAVGPDLAIRYELFHVAAMLFIVYFGSFVLQKIGASFHRRHSYAECFTTLAYSLSPLMLLRIADGFPSVPTWACYGIGLFLALSLFYRGVPTILKPDPSNALGLFMFCSFVIIAATGLAHFVGTLVLNGDLKLPI